MKKEYLFGFFILLLVIIGVVLVRSRPSTSKADKELLENITIGPSENPVTTTQAPQPTSALSIDKNKNYTVTLKTTAGDIVITMHTQETPITVNNFIVLSLKKYYNNTFFHRVIKGFMIQGGDPKGDGTGGPGYTFKDEPFTGEYKRGVVAMANRGPNTNGSQFFIMQADAPQLPKNYVIFGEVTKGMDVVDKIAESEVKPGPSGEVSTPVQKTTITSVDVQEIN